MTDVAGAGPALRQSAVERDLDRSQYTLRNRLRSIADDAAFVNEFVAAHPGLAVFGNLRQGVWYAPAAAARCYFKSTDGHYGAWTFNLTRTNLHVAAAAARCQGAVIVDATRRGKRFPDSQTRTIPIWAAVVNRCVRRLYDRPDWDTDLHLYPGVSPSERDQVGALIDAFVDALCASSADLGALAQLDRPLRPIWVDRRTGPCWPGPAAVANHFVPIICLSCSRDEDDVAHHGRRGWHYIQGAADDHENWAGPVTAAVFAADRARFAAAADDDECRAIALDAARREQRHDAAPRVVVADFVIAIVGDVADLDDRTPAIVIAPGSTPPPSPYRLSVNVVDSKTDKTSLERALPDVLAFYRAALGGSAGAVPALAVVAGDRNVAAALIAALIAVSFVVDGDQVRLRPGPEFTAGHVTKGLIRRALQVVQRWAPDLYPSRLLMQQLNRFFMSRPRNIKP